MNTTCPADVKSYLDFVSIEKMNHLELFAGFLLDWNSKINLISRKNETEVWEQHILHSILLTQTGAFDKVKVVIDVGTGGGLPGLPLAILYPNLHFILIDSIAKKCKAVSEMAESLKLKNVEVWNGRAEVYQGKKPDLVVTRAVAPSAKIVSWTTRLFGRQSDGRGRWLFLKGGDAGQLTEELLDLPAGYQFRLHKLNAFCKLPFFDTKYIVEINASSKNQATRK